MPLRAVDIAPGDAVIEAVTFDFWNTLVWERPGQLVERRLVAWTNLLESEGIRVGRGQLTRAHETAFDEYQVSWMSGRQYVAADATNCMLATLRLEVSEALRAGLLASFDTAGAEADVRAADGVAECLESLRRAGVKLGIVCDVGLTPSPTLLGHLDRLGLRDAFRAWAFSDEVGAYKPEPKLFEVAIEQLGVSATRTAHVGDRRRTDVAGARTLRMLSVRYCGIYDDPDTTLPDAHHVIHDYGELFSALEVDG